MKTLNYLILPLILLMSACGGNQVPEKLKVAGSEYDFALNEYLFLFESLPNQILNTNNPKTQEKIELGHALYFDTRLSKTGNNSCNSCHNLATFGVDNLPTSPGDNGGFGDRNSPTVLNAAFHASQFWDGRAADVEEQAGMPILNPVEMAIPSEEFLVERLKGIDLYNGLFSKAYPEEEDALTYGNIEKAIALFERELITPSRFDLYLNGDKSALNKQEKQGLISFVLNGCTTCHNGVALGGNSLQKFGVYDDYFNHTKSKKTDKGLAEQTGLDNDLYMFKTPSLRNIAETGPYFHDGSVSDLKDAIRIMGHIQLDKQLSQSEIDNIAAFFGSLTGNVPEKYKKAPGVLDI